MLPHDFRAVSQNVRNLLESGTLLQEARCEGMAV